MLKIQWGLNPIDLLWVHHCFVFSAEGAGLSRGQSRRQNCIISVVIWKRKQSGISALKVENGYAFQLIVPKIIKICYCIWQLERAK